MGRSNTANGGQSYIDVAIQLVSDDGVTQVLRAVVYLTTPSVYDSVNNLSVSGSGSWGRSGNLSLSGGYAATPVWYQDVAFGKGINYEQTATVSVSWSSVEYWGVTLSAGASWTIPGRPDPNPPVTPDPGPVARVPGSPGTTIDMVTPTSARLFITPPADTGSSGIDAYHSYILYNNKWPGGGGEEVSSSDGGTFTATNLSPSTQYFYTSRAHNAAGWSAWTPMKTFTTLPSALIRVGGAWKNALPFVKVGGVWKLALPYKKVGGVWKQ